MDIIQDFVNIMEVLANANKEEAKELIEKFTALSKNYEKQISTTTELITCLRGCIKKIDLIIKELEDKHNLNSENLI